MRINSKRLLYSLSAWILILLIGSSSIAQKAYFVDGFHGGVYGHFPEGFTRYIVNTLNAHPEWRLCLELEPATWDVVRQRDSQSYSEFMSLFENTGRMEHCNPGFAQSYLWNASGESNIRQFMHGINETKKHFPDLLFKTYSAEEPCFTSSLPAILKSLGVKFAVLKNPNTCWGGYTAAYNGELVNWIGSDGTTITTVPRYTVEKLSDNTTWSTDAHRLSNNYVEACLDAGIVHPVGMCFQDAGWRNGPWNSEYSPFEYTTWTNYFENIAIGTASDDWYFSQEDILVSLMWGSQVLQKLAQQVKSAENKIIQAEKMASIAKIYFPDYSWPNHEFNTSWENLLLSQHHDCWIVPLNVLRDGKTWADFVQEWTDVTVANSINILEQAVDILSEEKNEDTYCAVFNTLGIPNTGIVSISIPADMDTLNLSVVDEKGNSIPSQIVNSKNSSTEILVAFNAKVPSMGYTTYTLQNNTEVEQERGVSIKKLENGNYQLESDHYQIMIDPLEGGVITQLIAKKIRNKDFTGNQGDRRFNELRGYFGAEERFVSSTEQPAIIEILEKGPVRARIAIHGSLASTSFTQTIALIQGEERIDLSVNIEWEENVDIGEPTDKTPEDYYQNYKRPFYDDRYKLLALFPADLDSPKLYKNAPFDVCESKLSNTFFGTWDSIKHNIILDWVDIYDPVENLGLALFTDHTTSYAHGENHPLGIVLQYSGGGLWGRNYVINEDLTVNYAIIPHAGNWKDYGLETERTRWNEPLLANSICKGKCAIPTGSIINVENTGLEIVSMVYEGSNLIIRLYNSEGDRGDRQIRLGFVPEKAELVELNGEVVKQLELTSLNRGSSSLRLDIQQHGIRTLRFVKPSPDLP